MDADVQSRIYTLAASPFTDFLWSVVLGLFSILYLKRGAVSHIATVYNFD